MAEKRDSENVHELAPDEIKESTDRPVPLFLKVSYVGACLFGLTYLFLYKSGEVTHPTRGPGVVELNKALDPVNSGMIAVVAALLVVFSLVLFFTAFRGERGEK